MSGQQPRAALKPELWRTICDRARTDGMSPSDWLARQLDVGSTAGPGAADDEVAALLDLAAKHFAGLKLERREARMLAAGIYAAVQRGESHRVGPVGQQGRYYELTREQGAVSIRVGDGQIRLPMVAAMRLAGVLDGEGRRPARQEDVAA